MYLKWLQHFFQKFYSLGFFFFPKIQRSDEPLSPVSAVLGWKSVFVQVTNCSCRFRFGRRLLDRVMCISPSPLIFTPSTSAATFSVPSVALTFTCSKMERKVLQKKDSRYINTYGKSRRTDALTVQCSLRRSWCKASPENSGGSHNHNIQSSKMPIRHFPWLHSCVITLQVLNINNNNTAFLNSVQFVLSYH